MKEKMILYFWIILLVSGSCKRENDEIETLSEKDKQQILKIFVDKKVNKFSDLLRRYHERYHFNGNLLISYEGQVIFNDFIGYADMKEKDTLHSNAVYQLASVSKQFTAMAVMMLQEMDSLEYDDKMVKYVPELSDEKIHLYDSITIRHLLNHTSGLPNYMYFVEKYTKNSDNPYNDEIVELMAKHKAYLNFRPGSRFLYSNTGYMILALIVERASGMKFGDFVDNRIFKPLGMNHSFVYSAVYDEDRYKDKLQGYRKYRRYFPIPENQHDGSVGDKGAYSTVNDLFKWDRALNTDTLVSTETLEEAFSRGKLNSGKDIPYGYGFRIRGNDEDDWVVFHNGLWNGFKTGIVRYLDKNHTVIILEHTNSRGKDLMLREIEKILLSPHHNYTRVLVEKTLEEGLDAGNLIYESIEEMDLDLTLDEENIKKVYFYLDSIQKPKLAMQINMLYNEITGKHIVNKEFSGEKTNMPEEEKNIRAEQDPEINKNDL